MNSDEEYLDDFINSLMKEEAGEGPAFSEEGETEGFGLGEETVPKDLDFAIEDLMPEEFDAGDFVLEESGQEELPENLPEEFTLEEEPEQEEPGPENLPEESALEEEPGQEELPENLAEEPVSEEEPEQEELGPENLAEESVPEDISDEEPTSENEWEENPVFDDFGLSDFQVDEEENEEFHNGGESLISPDEVDAMFAAADAAADADLSALEEDALFDADLQTDEIFDFLDGMPEGEEGNGEPNPDDGQEMPAEEDDQGNKKKKKEKKAKKEKKPLFGKKKKGQPEEAAGTEESEEGASEEPEEKKTGLFGKIMTFLTETDDEEEEESKADGLEPSDENKNILKELDDEDKKKKKKKVKTKDGEDGEEGKKEKKKKKKEKKKKEKPGADSEGTESLAGVKKGKRVSIKSIAVIAAFCLTVTAVIIVTCSIIPDFFEKRKAREAFYQSDYMKSYELMYGKKLDESDDIIYNKAKTILEIKRKLDSYHNYLGMGKEVQALDALMSGVEHYPEILAKAEEYRVTQEVNAIYESILNILNDKYSLGEAVAQTIVAYDDVTYTKRLESIVYHTPFIMPEEKMEREETVTTADILPEEQELMEEQMPAAEDMLPEEEFPQEEMQEQQESDPAEQETAEEPDVQEENSSQGEDVSQWDNMSQGNEASQGEDVSTWTGDSGFGNQGEQIQGIRQPLNIEIHGN